MVYMDNIGHLVADSEQELHLFAQKLGLKREYYQNKRWPHYDLTSNNMKQKAKVNGAILISSKEIIKVLKKQLCLE